MTEETKPETELLEEEQSETDLVPITVNTIVLDQEATELLNKIIKETSLAKVNDLTELFNINQNKKTMARMDKMSNLLDLLTDRLMERVKERPDEMSNKDILDTIKVATDTIDKGNKQINQPEQSPLIQINQQDNSVNIDSDGGTKLNRASRERVSQAVSELLKGIGVNPNGAFDLDENEIIDSEYEETK